MRVLKLEAEKDGEKEDREKKKERRHDRWCSGV
jgi:hypothetical protein